MAGDWFPVDCTLPDKPEILAIARDREMHPAEALGRCIRVWIWFYQQADQSGFIKGAISVDVDRVAECSDFANAMVRCSWLTIDDDGLRVPNWERHFTQSAKTRALATARKRRERRGHDDVTPRRDRRVTTPTPTPIRHDIDMEIDRSGSARAREGPIESDRKTTTVPATSAKTRSDAEKFVGNFAYRIAVALELSEAETQRNRRSLRAAGRKVLGRSDRTAMADRLVAMAREKAASGGDNPAAMWQAGFNRLFPPEKRRG